MFLKQANIGKNAWYLYLVTLLAVFLGSVIGQIPLTVVIMSYVAKGNGSLESFQQDMDFESIGMNPNVGLFLILLSFVAGLLMLWLMVVNLHKKPFLKVLTTREKLDWRRIWFGFAVWTAIMVLMELVMYALHPDNYEFHFEWKLFIPLLAIALLLLPLQTSFEEILMRGYLMQGFALLFRNRWFPLLMTSAIFGGLHFMNPEVREFGLINMMFYYIGFGLVMGICTIMDDGLELALGVHAATNIYSAVLVSYKGAALKTPALFQQSELDMTFMLTGMVMGTILFLWVVSKKYSWTGWYKLTSKIDS